MENAEIFTLLTDVCAGDSEIFISSPFLKRASRALADFRIID